ncbi:Organic cation/carnitine transporter 7 [Hibiscus syriacus]|uniref:Organic cation/carnitine transporter 7 n=1 Tax=Hibiscus syriacus TaxID=106335 RepID=A0A6A2Z950_HIBSY|nr:organic cation/carnitine transporter 7-like [Hibiscus syriacus]KAE8688227.1 Organic cation/carnitine transporter 7 [Hibiscus syriacus]
MAEEARGTFTVDDALMTLGFGKYQFCVLGYAALAWVSEAMEMMLLSFIGPVVQRLWHLSAKQQSLITSVVFIGMLIGAYSWGVVADKYGRRKGFLMTALVTTLAGFASAFSPNYASLLVFRCVVGIGLGGGPVLCSWLLEFIPPPNRGTWMVVFQAFWTVGAVFEASIAWIVMPRLGWRWLLGFSSIPSFGLLAFYFITPESPRYLCLNGRTKEAMIILERIAEVNGTKVPLGTLVSEDYQAGLDEDETPAKPEQGPFSTILKLLSRELIRPTLLLWAVFFGNSFNYYGLVLLTTELNTGRSRCAGHKTESKISEDVNYKDVFITTFAEFPGLIIVALTIDRVGRRLSMAILFFICCILIFPLVFHQTQKVTTGLLFGSRVCITATFTTLFIYAPEVYPTAVRTTGFGSASSMGRIGGMICPYVAVALVQGCHQTAAIGMFEAIILLSGVCILLIPIETKGRELTDDVKQKLTAPV